MVLVIKSSVMERNDWDTKTMRSMIFVVLILAIAACANPGIVRLSSDTYMLSKDDHAGIFGSMSKLKADVINQANQFAAQQGKVAVPLASREKPVGYRPGAWASFEYEFRVVDKNDPEARRTSLVPRPDVVIDHTERRSVDVQTISKSDAKPDLYTELMKLDDLRKKGIITEDEFQTQKAKLLSAK